MRDSSLAITVDGGDGIVLVTVPGMVEAGDSNMQVPAHPHHSHWTTFSHHFKEYFLPTCLIFAPTPVFRSFEFPRGIVFIYLSHQSEQYLT